MKRYRFPLDAVARVRRVERDRAVLAAADAEREAAAAAEHVDEQHRRYGDACVTDRVLTAAEVLAHRQALERAVQRVRRARERSDVARAELLGRKAALAAAASAVRALELLEDRSRAEHTLAVRRAETKAIDDLVVSRFNRREHE